MALTLTGTNIELIAKSSTNDKKQKVKYFSPGLNNYWDIKGIPLENKMTL